MASEHVLGYLAQRFSISEENLASEALTWLLGQSAAARNALHSVARAAGVKLPESLTFVGQVGSDQLGRPDIVGSDPATGQECFLVEAKFAAALTPQQPGGYLARLPAGSSGILLVVAPTVRLPTLWVELLRAIPDRVGTPPAPPTVPASGMLTADVGAGHVLALISWRDLVGRVLQALRDLGEVRLAEDADQLLALTDAMDAAAYVPIRSGDVTTRIGRQIDQLGGVIDAVNVLVRGHPLLERASNSSHGRIFYGWYARGQRSRKSVWYGFLPRVWAKYGSSPLWCQVGTAPGWSRQRIAQALAPLNAPGQPGLYEDGQSFVSPLLLPEYTGQQETVAAVLAGLEAVVRCLDADIEPGEVPTADVIVTEESVDAEPAAD